MFSMSDSFWSLDWACLTSFLCRAWFCDSLSIGCVQAAIAWIWLAQSMPIQRAMPVQLACDVIFRQASHEILAGAGLPWSSDSGVWACGGRV